MANLIFGANLGSEILYNGVPYVLKETGKYTRNEFNTIPMNQNNISNIERPTYSFNDEGIESSYQYPLGAEAASYKYGWKAQGIVNENPMFEKGNFISPQPIKWIPKKAVKEYMSSTYNGYRYIYTIRYRVTDVEVNFFTAPCDGVLRIIGGSSTGMLNPTVSVLLYTHNTTIQNTHYAYCQQNGIITGDNIAIKLEGYLNETTPYEISNITSCTFNDAGHPNQQWGNYVKNTNLNEFLYPIQMKAGDTFCLHTNYLIGFSDSDYGTPPDELDITKYNFYYWFNGIFYPNKI